jgi:hypothetical protein
MERPGPLLEALTHRLAETPQDFLEEPLIRGTGAVPAVAIVNDLLLLHGARAPLTALQNFVGTDPRNDRNRLALVMIASWLLADEWFVAAGVPQAALVRLLTETIAELAAATPAHKFTTDPDRREELARLTLARLGFRPQGETIPQATDRLTSLSSTERKRLLAESRAAEKRAREIREALARKAAQESADKWSRE